jgi:hypothetical protein
MKFLSALRKKKQARDFYLSLILKPHKLSAILFEKTATNLVIVSTKDANLPKALDVLTGEDLVAVSDVVISTVEGALPEGIMVEKTIFSVPYSWQTDGKINHDHLLKLKHICDNLELKAIGFIVSAEAVVNLMQKKDGALTSAILVEHADQHVYVYIVKAGNIVDAKDAAVGKDFVQDVEDLLSTHDGAGALPPKIILHDYDNAESLQQKFLNHEWKKELNFHHVPQVQVLEKGFENEAVINGVATQMGFDVLADIRAGAEFVDEEDGGAISAQDIEIADSEDFGFVRDQDVLTDSIETSKNDAEVADDAEQSVGEDEARISAPPPDREEIENVVPVIIHDPYDSSENTLGSEGPRDESIEDTKKEQRGVDPLDTRVTLVDKVKGMLPLGFIKNPKLSPRLILIAVGLLALIALLTYGYFNFFLKTEVIIFADSKVITAEEEVSFEARSTSFENKTIKITEIEETVAASAEKDVTGTKETGEKATGEVTMYNKTEQPVTFAKGTIVTGKDMDFVIASEVKIASTSSFSTSFSNAKVKVEAAKFGKEYNLPSNTNFVIDGEDTADYFARNENAFSGGSKKELAVVSERDLGALEESVEKDTVQKAMEAASQKLGDDTSLVKTPLLVSVEDSKFSKKAGEEAKTVSLQANVVYTFGTYSREDLIEFVKQMGGDEIPTGYAYLADASDVQVSDVTIEDGDIAGVIKANAVFAPSIEASKMLGSLRGKRISVAEELVNNTSGVSDYTIIRKNAFPIFPSYLPWNTKNITITVKTDG